jgi:hypothetical protein
MHDRGVSCSSCTPRKAVPSTLSPITGSRRSSLLLRLNTIAADRGHPGQHHLRRPLLPSGGLRAAPRDRGRGEYRAADDQHVVMISPIMRWAEIWAIHGSSTPGPKGLSTALRRRTRVIPLALATHGVGRPRLSHPSGRSQCPHRSVGRPKSCGRTSRWDSVTPSSGDH